MRKRREIQELNTGSMADIAFLLLIFFLVTTTIDSDVGIMRIISPPVPPGYDPPDVRNRNVLSVLVDRNDHIMIESEPVTIKDIKPLTIEFLKNPYELDDLPEKSMKHIQSIGSLEVTKGIISIKTDRGTSYEAFIAVLNELVAAGNVVKNEASQKYFNQSYDELNKKEQAIINEIAPAVISEAEPNP